MREQVLQQQIRVLAAEIFQGALWRNNVGVAREQTVTGRERYIRYGLGNDSSQLNARFKSADLIGVTPITIIPAHVGRVFGVFTAVEIKPPGWRFRGSQREIAQDNFIKHVQNCGSIAGFAASELDFINLIINF